MAPSLLLAVALRAAVAAVQGYTWPNEQIDQLESMLYEHAGQTTKAPAAVVFPCPGVDFGKGRNTAAEWLRTAYHDMATADVHAGTGGIDASIGFEVNRDENVGSAFNETMGSLAPMFTVRSSMADLIALGAIQAVMVCYKSPILIPFRAGRIDATAAGPAGVPKPEEDLKSHTASFDRQGFNQTEMIALVACGHSIGGVHGKDFPEIVPVTTDTTTDDNTQAFDGTSTNFDNAVATEFVANITSNALAFGHNVTTRSDARIFTADGGNMISKMAASNDFFTSTCSTLLDRMVNTVPKGVKLSDPIQVIPVKPEQLYAEIGSDGTVTVSGRVRLVDQFSEDPNRKVLIHMRPRTGTCKKSDCVVLTATTGAGDWTAPLYGATPIFRRYAFSGSVKISQGFSGFDVEVIDGKNSTLYTNGGGGFPWDDSLLVQQHRSCQYESVKAGDPVKFVVATRDDAKLEAPTVIVYEPTPVDALVPKMVPRSVTLKKSSTVSKYTLWQASYTAGPDTRGTYHRTFDVKSNSGKTSYRSMFHGLADLDFCSS